VTPEELSARALAWAAGLPIFAKVLLTLATTMMVVELFLRAVAPRSRAYAGWKRVVEAVGAVWTGVILSVIYFVSVGLVGIGMRLFGKDPLDRGLAPEPTFWRTHEPNPLGQKAAVRHQF